VVAEIVSLPEAISAADPREILPPGERELAAARELKATMPGKLKHV
jgi:hypothetical protein